MFDVQMESEAGVLRFFVGVIAGRWSVVAGWLLLVAEGTAPHPVL